MKWLVLILVFGVNVAFGQSFTKNIQDTINQLDNKGKRTGYWIEYVNEKLDISKSKKKAVFFRYLLYDKGLRIGQKVSHAKKMFLKTEGNQPQHGEIVLMDGTYLLYDRKNNLSSEEIYQNGILLSAKSFYINGQVYEHIDYADKYQNQKGSYKITIYKAKKPGEIGFQYYFRKTESKWKLIKLIVSN